MCSARLWKWFLSSNLLWLLVVTLTGFYMILTNDVSVNEENYLINSNEIEAAIDNTENRIFNVKYEPVFEKYYHRFYGKKNTRQSILEENVPTVNYTADNWRENTLRFNKIWHNVDSAISSEGLFSRDDRDVNQVLQHLASSKIVSADVLDIGMRI